MIGRRSAGQCVSILRRHRFRALSRATFGLSKMPSVGKLARIVSAT